MMSSRGDIVIAKHELMEELLSVAREGCEFSGAVCPRITAPSPAEFLREYVLPNRPCIITDVLHRWKAMSLWTDEYLSRKLGDSEISVNVTPNGRGDAVLDDKYFVMPEERRMIFSEFLAKLKGPKQTNNETEIFYLSHQDDNLRTQFPTLLPDIEPTIRFAEDALGTPPDAVNLWMGGADAVTTMHMDHYENLYGVVRGEKRFTLLPPTSMPLLYPRAYEPRVYSKEGGTWHTRPAVSPGQGADASRRHTWISVNPEAPDLERRVPPAARGPREGRPRGLPAPPPRPVDSTRTCAQHLPRMYAA